MYWQKCSEFIAVLYRRYIVFFAWIFRSLHFGNLLNFSKKKFRGKFWPQNIGLPVGNPAPQMGLPKLPSPLRPLWATGSLPNPVQPGVCRCMAQNYVNFQWKSRNFRPNFPGEWGILKTSFPRGTAIILRQSHFEIPQQIKLTGSLCRETYLFQLMSTLQVFILSF